MAEMFLLTPQWQGVCILSEPEGVMHSYDEGKVKWLNVFMAACRGQISLSMCGFPCAGGVPRCLELGLILCVWWDQNESGCVCTGGWLCICAPDDVCVSSQIWT